MFGRIANEIKCEICNNDLEFDYSSTADDYKIMMSAGLENIYEKIDDVINKYLVYKCKVCGYLHRYRYADIEMIVRKRLTEEALFNIAKQHIRSYQSISTDKLFIYCGKCRGIDGSGCCTKTIFNNCDIKRFPINVI